MTDKHEFISKTIKCPKGHDIRLEILSGTPNMIRTIKCPTCQIDMVIIVGEIRGVVPVD